MKVSELLFWLEKLKEVDQKTESDAEEWSYD